MLLIISLADKRLTIKLLSLLTVIIVSGNTPNLHAQQFRPTMKWQTIQTDDFEVVFPATIHHEGQRVARLLTTACEPISRPLGIKPKPISVIVNNQSAEANGYLQYMPRMSEWYITPAEELRSLGTTDWFETLTLHEYRHVVQYDKLNRHFTRLGTLLYGEMGRVGLMYSVPSWFQEGDAILSETALSTGGRGRLPAFDMGIRTILLSGKDFTYSQAKCGTFRDFYPNHYHLGYLLCAHMRNNADLEVWNKVLTRTAKTSWWPWAFSHSLKKTTGLNEIQLYNQCMDSLKQDWKQEQSRLEVSQTELINKSIKRRYTNYSEPNQLGPGVYVMRKSGLDFSNRLITIDPSGKEQRLRYVSASRISASWHSIVWSSVREHPRWGKESWSEVYLYNIQKKKLIRTRRSKYFAPALNANADQIAVIEYGTDISCRLTTLNTQNFNVISSFNAPPECFLRNPNWSEDGKTIAVSASCKKGVALWEVDIESGSWKQLTPFRDEPIDRPLYWKHFLLYQSSYGGIDRIFALNRYTGNEYVVFTPQYGAFNVNRAADGGLLVQIYGENGYDAARFAPDTSTWTLRDSLDAVNFSLWKTYTAQENGPVFTTDNQTDTVFQQKKYPWLRHAVNIHSWGLFTYEQDGMKNPEWIVRSDNHMNTLSIEAGSRYLLNEKVFRHRLWFNWSKLFVTLSGGVDLGNMSYTSFDENDIWKENYLFLKVGLPLNLSRAAYYRYLGLEAEISRNNINGLDPDIFGYHAAPGYTFSPVAFRFFYQNIRHGAPRDVSPRLAQYVALTLRQTPFKMQEIHHGYLISAQTTLYVPSPLAHHAFRLHGAAAWQDPSGGSYLFSTEFRLARGHQYISLTKTQHLSIDYIFPLLFPDLRIGPLLYVNRVYAKLFADYTQGWNNERRFTMPSAGFEVWTDFFPFRLDLSLKAGLRFSRLLNSNQGVIELFLLGLPF